MSQWTGTFESGAIGVPMKVGPVQALTRALRGSFQTRGRSSRSEYWWFQLWIALALGAAVAFDVWRNGPLYAFLVVTLLVLAPSISVCVRRLHDAGYSGAWYFVQFLPFIGGVWLLVLVIQPSKRLATQYGPGPGDHLLR